LAEKIRKRIIISGRVQGVYFRDSLRTAAEREGVTGWVRNLPDRRVEAVLEGEIQVVSRVIEWSRQGPPAARVEEVAVIEEVFTGEFHDFEIRYSY
jgi:acylphosphatase